MQHGISIWAGRFWTEAGMVQISAQPTNRKSPWLVTPSFPIYSISSCKMEMIPWVPPHLGASFNSEASSGEGCSCSVTKSCLTLCDPTDGSPAGSSVLHCLPEFAETHAHWVDEGSEGRTPETDGVIPQASALGRTRCDVGISQGPPHHAQGDSSIFERNFFLYHAP